MDIPENTVSTILNEQKLWDHSHEGRNQSKHYHYQSLHKQKTGKRHATEKEHRIALCAVDYTTAKYVVSFGAAETTSSTVIEES